MSVHEQDERPRPAGFRFSHEELDIGWVPTARMKNYPLLGALLGARWTYMGRYEKGEYEDKSHPSISCRGWGPA